MSDYLDLLRASLTVFAGIQLDIVLKQDLYR
jgi:uncharacterized protein YwbE